MTGISSIRGKKMNPFLRFYQSSSIRNWNNEKSSDTLFVAILLSSFNCDLGGSTKILSRVGSVASASSRHRAEEPGCALPH